MTVTSSTKTAAPPSTRKTVFNGWNARAAISLQLAGANSSLTAVVDTMCDDGGVSDYTLDAAAGGLDRLCLQGYAAKTEIGLYNLTVDGHRLVEVLSRCAWRSALFHDNHRREIVRAVLTAAKGAKLTADQMASQCGMSRDSCRRGVNELVTSEEAVKTKEGRSLVFWIEVEETEPEAKETADLEDDDNLPPVSPVPVSKNRFLDGGDDDLRDLLDGIFDDDLKPEVATDPPVKPEVATDPPVKPEVATDPPVKPEVATDPVKDAARGLKRARENSAAPRGSNGTVPLRLPVEVVREAAVQAGYAGLSVEDYLERTIKRRAVEISSFIRGL